MQVEFNFEGKTKSELDFDMMDKKIQDVKDSSDKVRRKLFAELGEIKKQNLELQKEISEMKMILRDMHYEKMEWEYLQNGKLFELKFG